jgi:hypothetical protein
MTWLDLEAAAPEIARLGRERLERMGVALLGTVRGDGSPRISPIEAHVVRGRLVFGVMPWSSKARDLARDPRCAVHSAVSGPDTGEGELKLHGRAVELEDDTIRQQASTAWWATRPAVEARLFSLAIEQAAFVTWETARGLMRVRRWSAAAGYTVAERPYP